MANVLALSYGRKNCNTDIFTKRVLKKCEEAGHNVRFIRPTELDIKTCTGCNICVGRVLMHMGNGECVHKDDYPIIEEAFYWSDAVIVGSPVFETSPSGAFKNLCDRSGPSHDIAFLYEAKKEREADGIDMLPDERAFKPRIGCLLASGGARTKNWTVMTIPVMYEFFMSTGTSVIDTHVSYGTMLYENVVLNEKEMARADQMAQNIIDALASDNEEDLRRWRGEDEGACPCCHQNVFSVYEGSDKVECTICGIEGKLTYENGKAHYHFSDEELAHSRMTYAGKLEHRAEIMDMFMQMKRVENLAPYLEPYKHIGEDKEF